MRCTLLLICSAVISIGPVLADESAAEMDIQVQTVTDDIYLFSCFYGSHYVNVIAFSGPDGMLLVDSGHRRTAKALASELSEVNPGAVTYLINTHVHGDHTGGNSALGSSATIIAHENVYRKLLADVEDSLKADLSGVPDSTLSDSLVFQFHGDTVRVVHLPNGHTDGDVIVHFVHANVVCLGDLLFSDALPLIFKRQGGSLDGFVRNLNTVLTMFSKDAVLIPGHGRIYSMRELAKYRDMLSGITGRVRAELGTGKEIDEVFAADVLQRWKDWVSQEYMSDSAFVLMVRDNDRGN